MGQIGFWGTERFETSDSKVFTLSNIQRSSEGHFESFQRIGAGLKPLSEFIAPGLGTFNFNIQIRAELGVNPREVLDHWIELAEAGQINILVIGNKQVGTDQWALKSAQQTWEQLDGQGNVLTAQMSLSFEEYIST